MRKPIVQIPVVENLANVDVPMAQKLDDLIHYAKKGMKADKIASLLHIKKTQEIYHTLQFFGLSIAKLRSEEILLVMRERPTWTQVQIAAYLNITVHALRNQIHYRKNNPIEKKDEQLDWLMYRLRKHGYREERDFVK